MRIAMLGWEFPPFISGGLGTACYGLSKALDARGHEVLFVLPRPVDRSRTSHVRLLSPEGPVERVAGGDGAAASLGQAERADVPVHAGVDHSGAGQAVAGPFGRMRMLEVPAGFSSPYGDGGAVGARFSGVTAPDGTPIRGKPMTGPVGEEAGHDAESLVEGMPRRTSAWYAAFGQGGGGANYRGDLFLEAERYAKLVVSLTKGETIDVIHAHDWLTFPAGIALARATNRPLVVHVHSTEFDRSGDHINQRVYDVERRGMMAAVRVVTVSELTRATCMRRYGVPAEKIDVVYNGVDNDAWQPTEGVITRGQDKIVLFLGRLTQQKGPEYFITAARKVLDKVPEAKFIIAGTGDLEGRMVELAAELGIGHRVFFTGFLRGGDVDRIYRMADCYVMPSVSEPFGIAPLEAMRHDVPTIISKQSGVGEVLSHVLKVDFWDTSELANKIVAVLRHPPLSQTLRDHGSIEVRKLTWDTSAEGCLATYKKATDLHVTVTAGVAAGVM
jgi:glycosyltransferase involved in cell wall biosynthesis